MRFLIFILFFGYLSSPFCQSGLENIYIKKQTLYGGVAGGGITTTTTYTFVANAPIKLPHVTMHEKALRLEGGDTLFIVHSSYQPYSAEKDLSQDQTKGIRESESTVYTYEELNGNYVISVGYQQDWSNARLYHHNGKIIVAGLNEIVDEHIELHAP